MNELDTWHEREVICPWCGYKYTDSWEMSDGEHECPECEQKFVLEIETEVYYTTSKCEDKKT